MASNFSKDSLRLFHENCRQNFEGDIENIEEFVEAGYPVNSHADSSFGVHYSGFTPLHFAVKNKNVKATIYLLKNGADIGEKSANGWTPVHQAYYNKATHLISIIFQHSTVNTYVNAADESGLAHFHICCIINLPDHVANFILKGADVNCSTPVSNHTDPGFTPLHFAVKARNTLVMRLLLENGGDHSSRSKGGLTPLHLACELDAKAPAEVLLEFGADFMARDDNNRLPLHSVFYKEHTSPLVDLLLDKIPTDRNYADCQRLTVLHIACLRRNVAVAKLLLAGGCCPNVRFAPMEGKNNTTLLADRTNLAGLTPLHMACVARNLEIVKELISAGADINAQDRYGSTPLSRIYNASSDEKTGPRLGGDLRKIDALIVNHMKRSVNARIYVSNKCMDELAKRNFPSRTSAYSPVSLDACIVELEKIQSIKIDGCADGILRSILTKSETEMSWLVKDEKVTTCLNPAYLDFLAEEFPLYGFVIRAQVNKGLRIIARLKRAKDALNRLTRTSFPDLCSERIFKSFGIEHLENLIDASADVSREKARVS